MELAEGNMSLLKTSFGIIFVFLGLMRLAEPGATLLGMAVVMQDSHRNILTILGLTRRVIVLVRSSSLCDHWVEHK